MLHAHKINLQVKPDDKQALARSLGNVATGYRAERNIVESAAYHEQALAVAELNNERLAPEVLTIRCNLALDYGTLGRHEQARAAQHVCNELTVERFGVDHPANVANLNNLGALDIRLGNLVAAEEAYLEALRIAESKLPAMSLERMAVEINFAVVLWHSGRIDDAETNLRDLLERMARSVGSSHPASARIRSILGRVVLERGDARTAKGLIEDSIQGLTPYWRSDAMLWLSEANMALSNPSDAAEQARESLELRKSIPHFTDWQIAEAEFALARATDDEKLLNRAAEQMRHKLPTNHFRRSQL
jgi:tetratricopeptide (TPR) repeat protein